MAESITPVYEAETVIKNEYDFRRELLSALKEDFSSNNEVKDTEIYRQHILHALEQEFDQDDIKQINNFRAKVVDGVKELVNGGGGGTATVQITNNNSDKGVKLWGPIIYNNVIMIDISFNGTWHIDQGSSDTFTVPLATGGMRLYVGGIPNGKDLVITGGGTWDVDNNCFIITGNCTITV